MMKKGFTLIELLVVIIIVGILASVAIPMMRGNINRARATEAVAALGALRSAERAYYSEHPTIPWQPITNGGAGDSAGLAIIGLAQTDLDGRYFTNQCYSVDSSGFITCDANLSTAPRAVDVNTMGLITMDSNGSITGG